MYTELNKKDFEVILDVLNVYDPNDIIDVYPAMGDKEFTDGVREAWRKVFKVVRLNNQCGRTGLDANTSNKQIEAYCGMV
jgi:hypothetical protein